jgi:hypothetical protein
MSCPHTCLPYSNRHFTPIEMPVITEDLYLGGIEDSIIIENIRLHSKSEEVSIERNMRSFETSSKGELRMGDNVMAGV